MADPTTTQEPAEEAFQAIGRFLKPPPKEPSKPPETSQDKKGA